MSQIRQFATGATRDADADKIDLEGFLSPLVIDRFGEYMHEKRKLPDGSYRESDNWQLGIPLKDYMKSGFRHFKDWWRAHRGYKTKSGDDIETELCALIFNASGYLHELLKASTADKPVKGHRLVATDEDLERLKREFADAQKNAPLPHWHKEWSKSGGLPDPIYCATASHPMASEALREEFQRDDQGTGV